MLMFGRGLPRTFIYRAILAVTAAAGIFYSVHFQSENISPAEAGRAALSFLRYGEIADPFVIPTGPTAQVSPPMTLLLAAVYFICGGNDPAARVLLSVIATAAYVVCLGLTFATCRSLTRSSKLADIICILFSLLVPVSLFSFIVETRQYEQPIASALLMLALYIWADRHAFKATRKFGWALLGLLGGFAGLLSPAILPSIVITVGAQRWSRRWRVGAIVGALAVVVAVMAFWTVRNEAVFSKIVLTRSNFGLELAIGNNDLATGYYSATTFDHPSDSVAQANLVRTLGELEYMHRWSIRAESWIRMHPARFLALTAKRIEFSFFPPPALIGFDPLFGRALLPLMLLLGTLKLAALFIVVLYRARVLMWLSFTVLPLAAYFITHINVRYELITFFPTVCLIACASCVLRDRLGLKEFVNVVAQEQPNASSEAA